MFMWFHPGTARRLGQLLEIPADRVAEAMGDDIRQTWVNNNYAMEGIVHEQAGEGHTDCWGIEWVREGEFNQVARHPLDGASPDVLLEYAFPFERVDELVLWRRLGRSKGAVHWRRCVAMRFRDVQPCLRGMENASRPRGIPRRSPGTLYDFSVLLAEKVGAL